LKVKLVNGVCLVNGKEAVAIYDFNKRKLYRVDKENCSILSQAQNTTILYHEVSNKEKKVIDDCLSMGIMYDIEEVENKLREDKNDINDFIYSTIMVDFCWLEITSICNQKCMHCFMHDELNTTVLEVDEIRKIVLDLKKLGVKNIALSGGEPTLHPNLIEIMDIIYEQKIGLVILTNGLKMSDEVIERILKYNVLVRIPILGIGKNHDKMTGKVGSYEICRNNIDILAKKGANLTITTTVTCINMNDLEKIQEYADDLDVDLEVAPLFPIGAAKINWAGLCSNEYQKILDVCNKYETRKMEKTEENSTYIYLPDKIKKYSNCGTRNMAVLSSGEYVPCLLMRDEVFRMGTIKNESLVYLVSEKNVKFNEVMDMLSTDHISECKECEVKHVCKAGGCRAVTYLFENNVRKKNPYYVGCYY